MKKYFFFTLSFILFILFACSKYDHEIYDQPIKKEKISLQNMGEVHNYLLELRRSTHQKDDFEAVKNGQIKFEDFYKAFTEELNQNDRYIVNPTVTKAFDNEVFEKIMNLSINKDFYIKARELALAYLYSNSDINQDVTEAIAKISDIDYYLTDDEISDIINSNKNKKGGQLLIVFKNIYQSSSEYWNTKRVLTKSSQSRSIMIADGIGGVLGTTCNGVMGIIWATAFSYALDACYDI